MWRHTNKYLHVSDSLHSVRSMEKYPKNRKSQQLAYLISFDRFYINNMFIIGTVLSHHWYLQISMQWSLSVICDRSVVCLCFCFFWFSPKLILTTTIYSWNMLKMVLEYQYPLYQIPKYLNSQWQQCILGTPAVFDVVRVVHLLFLSVSELVFFVLSCVLNAVSISGWSKLALSVFTCIIINIHLVNNFNLYVFF